MSSNQSEEEECSTFYQSAYDDDSEMEQEQSNDELSQGVGVATFDEDDADIVDTVSMDFGIQTSFWDQIGCAACCIRKPSLPRSTNADECDDLADIEKPSNEKLLSVAFISFFSLTICQVFAAFIAQSESMMGDSAAMVVDAITYGFNLVAERRKIALQKSSKSLELVSLSSGGELSEDENDDENMNEDNGLQPSNSHANGSNDDLVTNSSSLEQSNHEQLRSKRKMKLALEIFPPLFSVMVLIGLNSIILRRAIQTLINESKGITEKTPNVQLMFIFSFLNLVVDLINMFYFSKADHAMGYNAVEKDTTYTKTGQNDRSSGKCLTRVKQDLFSKRKAGGTYSPVSDDAEERAEEGDSVELQQMDENLEQYGVNGLDSDEMNQNCVDPDCHQHGVEETNLNMCSAYTHVFADTLRSIAVIIAAIVGAYAEGVSPERADALAAVVVSIIIVLALFPLFAGLRKSITEFASIHREEGNEWQEPSSRSVINVPPIT